MHASRRYVPVFCIAWLAGCSSPPAAATPSTTPEITLHLESATVAQAVSELATASGESVVIDPAAERYASCTMVTLVVPTSRPVPEVEALLTGAIASSGFTLVHGPHGVTLSHVGAPPPGCGASLAAALAPMDLPPMEVPPPLIPDGSVHRVSDTEVEIERAAMDAWRNDTNEMARSVRVIPFEENGVTTGVRLYGIRRSSPLGAMGFVNGDTVHSINGHSLADPDELTEAYSALRDVDEYRVEVTRRGERLTHVIRVVPPRR